MGEISSPDLVKPIIGLLYKEPEDIEQALGKIEQRFSPVDYSSAEFPFIETEYYEREMGANLIRRYVSLRDLINPNQLAHLKVLSNQCEDEQAVDGKRTINLDPGYIGAANLVLASTKNFSQRIYLDQGIYAEVTMTFARDDFHKLPWTYPDYYNHRDVLLEIRKIYRSNILRLNSDRM